MYINIKENVLIPGNLIFKTSEYLSHNLHHNLFFLEGGRESLNETIREFCYCVFLPEINF